MIAYIVEMSTSVGRNLYIQYNNTRQSAVFFMKKMYPQLYCEEIILFASLRPPGDGEG